MKTLQQKAVTTTYENTVNLLRKTVWKYIKQQGRHPSEFDELFSRAHIHFMVALTKYEESKKVKQSTWIIRILWNGLKNDDRIQHRIHRNKQRPPRPAPPKPPSWMIIDVLDELTEDGKNLLLLFRQSPKDLQNILSRSKGRPSRPTLFRYLKRKGWTRLQIETGFNDIKQIFS